MLIRLRLTGCLHTWAKRYWPAYRAAYKASVVRRALARLEAHSPVALPVGDRTQAA